MRATFEELEQRLIAQLENVDPLTLVVLKGQLLLEELLSEVIETFVYHAEFADDAKLTFAQKVALARSMSANESRNSMWPVINSINALRNDMTHSIESPKRAARLNTLRENFLREVSEPQRVQLRQASNLTIVTQAVALSLGFMHSFNEEIHGLKALLTAVESLANPHRHGGSGSDM